MPDIFSLLGAGATLLGSLNRSTPATEFDAVKFIDEQDPIRKTLEAVGTGTKCTVYLQLVNGDSVCAREIIEIGYGAFRFKYAITRDTFGVYVLRYSAVIRVGDHP